MLVRLVHGLLARSRGQAIQRPATWIATLALAGIGLTLFAYQPSSTASEISVNLVFGQPNFTTSTAPTPPTAASLSQPGGLVIDPTTGRFFVADTLDNRVLSWESVDSFEIGDSADVVIG